MATRSVPEGDVQLNLSREELLRLVQVVYIAAWIMDAHKTEEKPGQRRIVSSSRRYMPSPPGRASAPGRTVGPRS